MKKAPPMAPADFSWILKGLQEDQDGFTKLAKILKMRAGINLALNEKNLSLMAGRLNPILREQCISTYSEYLDILLTGDDSMMKEFVSAMATNTTEFFRESNHFTYLRDVVTQMFKDRKGLVSEIRVWCAACSTGQEPYSILMTILESLPAEGRGTEIKVLASDIDENALQKASQGVYTGDEMKNVPQLYRQKYFFQVDGTNDKEHYVQKTLTDRITFAPFNLMTEPYPFQHPFDFIWCRNVLIYFERETAQNVIHKMAQALRTGGHLFVGHSETGMVRTPLVETAASAMYRKKGGA